MNGCMRQIILFFGVVMCVSHLIAGNKWEKVGELTQGGNVKVEKEISIVKLVSTDDIATVNTLMIKIDGSWQTIAERVTIGKGESKEFSFTKSKVSEIGMSLETRGKVEIFTK